MFIELTVKKRKSLKETNMLPAVEKDLGHKNHNVASDVKKRNYLGQMVGL